MTLCGFWGMRNETTQLHLAGAGLYGLSIALDGLARPDEHGLRIDGIFTVTVRGAQHVEQVRLYLARVSSPVHWLPAALKRLSVKAAV